MLPVNIGWKDQLWTTLILEKISNALSEVQWAQFLSFQCGEITKNKLYFKVLSNYVDSDIVY